MEALRQDMEGQKAHLEDLKREYPAQAGEINGLIARCEAVIAKVDSLLERIGAYTNGRGDGKLDKAIREADMRLGELEEKKRVAEEEALYAVANEARNRYVVGGGFEEYMDVGNDRVVWIGPGGEVEQFEVQGEPWYGSPYRYEDGSVNYYPEGVEYRQVGGVGYELRMDESGGYEVKERGKGRRLYYNRWGQLERVVERGGYEVRLVYDDEGRVVKVEGEDGRWLAVHWEGGHVVRVEDQSGRRVEYRYNSAGQMVGYIDVMGNEYRYRYGEGGLSEIEKPDGSVRRYWYADVGGVHPLRIVRIEDEDGYRETFAYYPEERRVVHINRSGVKEEYYLNEEHKVEKIVHSDGSWRAYEYNEWGDVVRERDEAGYEVRYRYNERGELVERVGKGGTVEEWEYDEEGNVVAYVDEAGRRTEWEYDEAGNMVAVEWSDGVREEWGYDGMGNVVWHRDGEGEVVGFEYDGKGDLMRVKWPDGTEEEWKYDEVGRPVWHRDPEGGEERWEWRADGKVARYVDREGGEMVFRYNVRSDLVEVIDREGGVWKYRYDRRHHVVEEEDPEGMVTRYTYGGEGNLVRKERGGSVVRYEYDGRGRVVRVVEEGSGVEVRRGYTERGEIAWEEDGEGRRREWQYGPEGEVVWMGDGVGGEWRWEYAVTGKVERMVAPDGGEWEWVYDKRDRVVEVRGPEGYVERYWYDRKGRVVAKEVMGRVWRYWYDPRGRVVKEEDPGGGVKELKYDGEGRIVEEVDREGGVWRYWYDREGRLVRKRDPSGVEERWGYDREGRVVWYENGVGNRQEWRYNKAGQVVAWVDAYGKVEQYRYNALGLLEEKVDRRGGVWKKRYNSAGLVVKEEDPEGVVWERGYDRGGLMVWERDGEGREWRYEYDGEGRLVKKRGPDGAEVAWEYDVWGNVVEERDGNGGRYRWERDLLGRVVREVNEMGAEQVYRYNERGDMVERRDFGGEVERYRYDEVGRRVEVTFGDGMRWGWRYDREGRVVEVNTDERWERYRYDGAGRVVRMETSEGEVVEWEYDEAGRAVVERWREHEVRREYGKMGEVVTVTDGGEGVIELAYDEEQRVVGKRYPGGMVERYGYDGGGRMEWWRVERGPWGRVEKGEAYVYNKAGEVMYAVDEAGRLTRYGYDEAGRLGEVWYPLRWGVVAEAVRERVEVGLWPEKEWEEVGEEGDENEEMAPGEDERRGMALYERMGENRGMWGWGRSAWVKRVEVEGGYEDAVEGAYEQLTGRRWGLWKGWWWGEGYEYDRNGNRVRKENALGTIGYQYDPMDRMVQVGNMEVRYDENGNKIAEQVGRRVKEWAYNGADLPVEVRVRWEGGERCTLPGWERGVVVRYRYDGLGRQVERRVSGVRRGVEEVERYVYRGVGFQVLGEVRSEERVTWWGLGAAAGGDYLFKERGEERGGGVWWSGGEALRSYEMKVYVGLSEVAERRWGRVGGRDEGGDDRHWGWGGRGEEVVYVATDRLGSVRCEVDRWGRVVREVDYDVWGRQRWRPGVRSWEADEGYLGKQWDRVAGAYWYGFRAYEPGYGRFTTVDPIKSGTNWYAYCLGDPVNLVDLWGLRDFTEEEKRMITAIVGDLVDLSTIQIEDRSPTLEEVVETASSVGVELTENEIDMLRKDLESGKVAMSLPNGTIYVPPDAKDTQEKLYALIVHEVFHQYQYQKEGAAKAFQDFKKEQEQLLEGKNPYNYKELTAEKNITTLDDIPTLEGRAQFVEHFARSYFTEKWEEDLPENAAEILKASGISSPAVEEMIILRPVGVDTEKW